MKKKILVMATITIEGESLSKNFILVILSKIQKYFAYKFKFSNSKAEIVKIELSDNYVELQ